MVKKVYNLFYILNILCAIMLLINYLFIYNYSSINIFIFSIFLLFYIISLIIFFKNKKEYFKIDFIMLIIYIIFMIGLFISSIIIQNLFPLSYAILDFTRLMLIPHIIFIIYNYK